MENFSDRGIKKSVDWALVAIYLLLILIGWINIYASIHSEGPASIFDFGFRCGKKFVWILTALGLGGVILFAINPQFWESRFPRGTPPAPRRFHSTDARGRTRCAA